MAAEAIRADLRFCDVGSGSEPDFVCNVCLKLCAEAKTRVNGNSQQSSGRSLRPNVQRLLPINRPIGFGRSSLRFRRLLRRDTAEQRFGCFGIRRGEGG